MTALSNSGRNAVDVYPSVAKKATPTQLLEVPPKIKYSENRYDGCIPMLAQDLDGTPNPPTPPDAAPALQPRKGKVAELKKAFERGLSDLVRRRHVTKPSDSPPAPRPGAKHLQQHSSHPVAALDTSSPEDSLSRASVFCSPLSKRRREPNGPPSPIKDRISIFEGLVKPGSFPPSGTGFRPDDCNVELNKGSISNGGMVLEGAPHEPMSRLPSRFRGGAARRSSHRHVGKEKGTLRKAPKMASSHKLVPEIGAVARDSLEQLNPVRRDSGPSSMQRIDETDSPRFFKRVSSTLKHGQRTSQQQPTSSRSSRVSGGVEKEKARNHSAVSQSTSKSQEVSHTKQRQVLAADSLRKRLESDLRFASGPDANGHEDVQAASNRTPPSIYTRRKTTLWDIENPFDVPKAKERSKSEATGDRLAGLTKRHDLSFCQAIPGQKATTSRYTQPIEQPESGSESPARESSSAVTQTEDSDSSGFMVVANAQCELTHPMPSRSREQTMIKVLCKGGPEPLEKGSRGQHSTGSVSEGSTSSFHTAPLGTEVS
ncbi:hypothetical protein KVR01_001268 [Diaporthe batatas]|uniref:uncharacterized protein n=1 Tax=Diaporthe batatas TaxID=748121 RepID=UPI001D0599C6|nr:uncharacterized protein KVR01_001268 [Diaporthe batatas]KAG8168519.1 hypothetical protein KVR01_001268 [Diaporthe batatas]